MTYYQCEICGYVTSKHPKTYTRCPSCRCKPDFKSVPKHVNDEKRIYHYGTKPTGVHKNDNF